MRLPTIALAVALLAPACLAIAEDAPISLNLTATVPQILPEASSHLTPPTAQGTQGNLWLPPKHTDVIVPFGIPWPLPPLIQTKTAPSPASPEIFTAREVEQILYARPEQAGR